MASPPFPTLRYVHIADGDTMIGNSCVQVAKVRAPVLKGFLEAIAETKKES